MVLKRKPRIYIIEIGEVDSSGRNMLGLPKANSQFIGARIAGSANLKKNYDVTLEFFFEGQRIEVKNLNFKKKQDGIQEAIVGFPPEKKVWKAGTYTFMIRDNLSGKVISERSFSIGTHGIAISIKSCGEEIARWEYREGLAKITSEKIGGKITITPIPKKKLILKVELLRDNILMASKIVEVDPESVSLVNKEFVDLQDVYFNKPTNNWLPGEYTLLVRNPEIGQIVDQQHIYVVDTSILKSSPPIDKKKATEIAQTFVAWNYSKFYHPERIIKIEKDEEGWKFWFKKKGQFETNTQLAQYIYVHINKETGKVKSMEKPY